MTEEIKAKRDALIEDEAQWCQCKGNICHNCEPIIRHNFAIGFDAGFALAMEEAMSLVECLKVVGNYLYFMGDELTGDDFVGDGALTKRYNEKLNLIEQALKEFKEKTQ